MLSGQDGVSLVVTSHSSESDSAANNILSIASCLWIRGLVGGVTLKGSMLLRRSDVYMQA